MPIPAVIDVATWRLDDDFATYPEGARSKRAFFPPEVGRPDFVLESRRYMFKRSDEKYPDQFWGEVIASHIGQMIGVPVPQAYPGIDSGRETAGALIEWFYADGKAVFLMGGNFMQKVIDDFDRKKGEKHNFQSIRTFFKALHRGKQTNLNADWMIEWARGLTFDALIGNTDRHQDNWGMLVSLGEPTNWRLAPWYDNGTSLGHERWEQHVARWTEADYLRYILKGRHHMRWELSSPDRCGFFEMAARLVELDSRLRGPMLECVARLDVEALESFLAQCRALPIKPALTEWRCGFLVRLLKLRRKLLLEKLS